MIRFLSRTFLVATLALCPTIAPAQDDDGSRIERFLEGLLSEDGERQVSITGFRGALSSEATLERLTIADADGIWLELDDAVLDWNRSAVLRGEIEIEQLTAARLQVFRAPLPSEATDLPTAEAQPFSLPDLPVSIDIGQVAIDDIILDESLIGQPIRLTIEGSASLSGGAGAADISLRTLEGPSGTFALDASYDNDTRDLSVNVLLEEDADGIVAELLDIPDRPSLRLTIAGEGPINNITADIDLETEGEPRISGTVVSTQEDGGDQEVVVDIGGDISPLLAAQYREFFGDDVALQAQVRQSDEGTELEGLSLTSAALNLQGDVSLDAQGLPNVVSLTGQISPPEGADVQLPTGGSEVLISSASLIVDYDRAEGDTYSLTADLSDLRAGDISVAQAALSLSGMASITADGVEAATADLTTDLSGLSHTDPALAQAIGDALNLEAMLSYIPNAPIILSELSLTSGDVTATGGASGMVGDGTYDISLDLDADVPDLTRFAAIAGQPPLQGAVSLGIAGQVEALSAAFDLVITGTGQDLILIDAVPAEVFAGETDLSARAIRDADGLRLEGLELRNSELALTADAALSSTDIDATTQFRLNDLGLFTDAMSGPVTINADVGRTGEAPLDITATLRGPNELQADVEGTFDPDTTDFAMDVAASGRDIEFGDAFPPELLAGQTQIAASATSTDGVISLTELTVDGQQISVDGTATYGPERIDADLRARLADVGLFTDVISGPVEVDATVARTGTDPLDVTATVRGPSDIRADVDGTFNPDTIDFDLALVASAQDVDLGDALPAELLTGRTDIRVNAESTDGEITLSQLSVQGEQISVNGDAFYGTERIEADLTARLTDVGLFTDLLSGPVAIDANVARTGTDPLDVSATLTGPSEIEAQVDGTVDPETIDFDLALVASAQDLTLGTVVPAQLFAGRTDVRANASRSDGTLSVTDLSLNGSQVTVSGNASMGTDTIRADIDARLANVGLFTDALSGPVSVNGNVAGPANGPLQVSADLGGPGGMNASVNGQVLQDGGAVNITATGQAPLSLANRYITPRAINGTLGFNLAMNGQPSLGALSGSLSSTNARIALPTLSFAIENVGLSAQLSGGNLNLNATGAISTGGQLNVDGAIDLASAGIDGQINIAVRDALIVDPTLYEARISTADITVAGALARGPQVSGTVNLGESEIRVPETGLGGSATIPDIRHVSETPEERLTRQFAGLIAQNSSDSGGSSTVGLDLTVNAPGRIFLRGRGIDAEFSGSLRLFGTTANIIPTGQFDLVRGRLSLLGTRLDFTEGSVVLQGSFDPVINLVATNRTSGYTITIGVAGAVSSPDITFASDPSLPEDEVLAQLLFGRDVSSLSPVQLLQLADAAASLAGGSSNSGFIAGLRDNLGLDDLDLTTDSEGNAAVTAGRYLSENIYTDVTVGAGGTADLSLNIDLTESITARGSVGSDGGSSLGVFFERDY